MTREDLLTRHEGLKLRPYRCPAGALTIGVGRNLDANGISKDEAMLMLRNDLTRCEEEARQFPWYAGLDPARQAVIVDMVFNLGLSRFLGFKRFLAALSVDDFQGAAREMRASSWSIQVGDRADELARMMETGLWPT